MAIQFIHVSFMDTIRVMIRISYTVHVQDIINATESHGVFVQVRAGIDIINQEATWELQALDPETGIQCIIITSF